MIQRTALKLTAEGLASYAVNRVLLHLRSVFAGNEKRGYEPRFLSLLKVVIPRFNLRFTLRAIAASPVSF